MPGRRRPVFVFNWSVREAKKATFWLECAAELLATFFFLALLIGTNVSHPDMRTIHVAIGTGLYFTVLIEAFGHISGAHLNPAVTMGFFLHGKVTVIRAICYTVFQLIGATLGTAFALGVLPSGPTDRDLRANYYVVSHVSDKLNVAQGFALEMVATFLLMFSILNIADDGLQKLSKSSTAASSFVPSLIVGFTISACICLSGSHTGASMNPARSFGPSVVTGIWYSDFWVYLTAPYLGAVLAIFLQKLNLEREYRLQAEAEATPANADECNTLYKDGVKSTMSAQILRLEDM